MEQSASASFLWTCPSCGRRVPRRVDECRCGFKQSDAPVEAGAAPPAATSTARGSRRWPLMMFGLLVVVGAGLFEWQAHMEPAAAAGKSTRLTTTPPPASASAGNDAASDDA